MIGIDWLLIGAVALLVTILLLGFVGCGLQTWGIPPSDYPTAIQTTPGLVAYWRLGEPASTPVAVFGGPIPSGDIAFSANDPNNQKDPNNPFNGAYVNLNASVFDTQRHSFGAEGTGGLTLGVTPGLLIFEPTSSCMYVDGGYVQVPFNSALNPPAFSLEAWLIPFNPSGGTNLVAASGPPYYQCIVESTGPQGLGPRTSGWGLYIGPQDPNAPAPVNYFWQVWMYDDTNQFHQVASSQNPIVANQLYYVVLTFDPAGNLPNLQLFAYLPNTQQDLSIASVRALEATVTGFQPNTSGDFFICTGSNLVPGAGPPNARLYPFYGQIQEVAFYNVDLSGGAPTDPGVSGTLAVHEMAGGEF